MDPLIARAELRRDGLILTADLRQLGFHPGALRELVRDQHLVRIRRGVCVRAARWDELRPDARYRDLVRSIQHTSSRGLVVMGASAAVMHGLPLVGALPARVHALAPGERGGSSNRYLATHLGPPDPEATEIDGVLVTSLARTLVDLARTAPEISSIAALDHALRAVRLGEARTVSGAGWAARPSQQQLLDLLEMLDPRAGYRRALRTIQFASPSSMSVGESVSRCRIADLGFEMPILQQRFRLADGTAADADFWWEGVRLVGEFDGEVKYLDGRMRGGLHADQIVVREKLREDGLRALGLNVARWTWSLAMDPQRFGAFLARSGVPRA